MKEMTPMKRYRTTIEQFKKLIPSYVNEVNLNKSEKKIIPWPFQVGGKYFTKGVENDFITFFEGENNISVAFAFTYIDKNSSKNKILSLEEQMVIPSAKNLNLDGKIFSSQPIKASDFNERLKAFNKLMLEPKMQKKINSIGFVAIVEEFSSFFLNEKFDLKSEMKNVDLRIKDFLLDVTKKFNLEEVIKNKDLADNDYKETEKLFNKKVGSLPEYKRKEALLKELNEVEISLSKKINEIKKDLDIVKKKNIVKDFSDELNYKSSKIKDLFDEKTKDLPEALRKEIKQNKLKL